MQAVWHWCAIAQDLGLQASHSTDTGRAGDRRHHLVSATERPRVVDVVAAAAREPAAMLVLDEEEPVDVDVDDDSPASGKALLFDLARAFENGAPAVEVMTPPPTSDDESVHRCPCAACHHLWSSFLVDEVDVASSRSCLPCALRLLAQRPPRSATASDVPGGAGGARHFRLSAAVQYALDHLGEARPAADRSPFPDVDDKKFPQEKVLTGLRGMKISLVELFAAFLPDAPIVPEVVPDVQQLGVFGEDVAASLAVAAPPVKRAKKQPSIVLPAPVGCGCCW